MSAVRSSRARSAAASTSMPSMPSVPLMSARPSFSARTSGWMPAAARAPDREQRAGAAVPPHRALAHRRQRAVRERRQVAGAAERAVLAHHGGDARVQHARVGLRDRQAHAGAAGGQRGQPQQHQRADHLGLHLGARARRVRADQAALQLGAAVDRDVLGRERPEPGRDPVVRLVVGGQVLDDLAAGGDLDLGVGGELYRRAVPRHRHDIGEAERPGAHDDGVHASHVTARQVVGARGAEVMMSGIQDM